MYVKYHTCLFPWQLSQRAKRLPAPLFALLYRSLPVAPRPMPGAPSPYEFQMLSATRAQDPETTRKDNFNGTEEIDQTRGSYRNICRGPSCGNVEQFPARKSY
jgi:hypothetical protein